MNTYKTGFLILILHLNNVVAQFNSTIELSNLNGENGFIITNHSGGFVSPIGDINNDGIDDVLFSSPSDDTNGTNTGVVYVLFGNSLGFKSVFDLSTLNGTNGFVIYGLNDNNQLYKSQNGGDINNDGINDLLIGAPGVGTNGSFSGASYVIFGRNNFSAIFDLTTLNGTNGFVINGFDSADTLGSDVSFINDINDDGIDDLIVGAPTVSGLDNGNCYIIFGSSNPFFASFNLSLLNGSNGFTITGINRGDGVCSSVSALGDINGDGITDINIGASPQESISGQYYSLNYIVFGSNQGFPSSFDLNQMDGTNGFSIKGIDPMDGSFDQSTIYSAGDFNNDGIDDFIVGFNGADINGIESGSIFIIFGSQQPWPINFDLATLNGANGFRVNGIEEYDRLGGEAKTIGDVNNDGIDDIIMTATAFTNPFNPLETYPFCHVLFGSDQGFSSIFDIASLNGNNGFNIKGITPQLTSKIITLNSAGDINEDGIDDIILGGGGVKLNGIDTVAGYVIYGRGDLIFKNEFE